MQTIAHEKVETDTRGVGLMVTKENSTQKHRRLMAQAGEIAEYARTFGPLEAMDRYDIHMPQTLQKIIVKGGKSEQQPLVSKRAMFGSVQDYYDGIVQGIINRIVTMQTTNSELQRVIEGLRTENEQLKNELQNHSAMGMIRQEKKVTQLLNLIEV